MGKALRPTCGQLRRVYSLLALSFFLSPIISASEAALYYAATNGTDSAPGTLSQPFRSIAKGMSLLKAGDTLFIRGGTYTESINSNSMLIPPGGSWSTAVTMAAYPGEVVILRPNSGGEAINLAHPSVQYLIIDGLVIDGTNVNFAVSLTNGAHHVRIQNSEIKNSRLSGAILTAGTAFNQFMNTKIHHNGASNYDHGIYIATSNNLVERCEIYSNSGYGIHVYTSSPGEQASNNTVQRNIVRNNGVLDASSAGIILSSGDGNRAYNNIVYGNPHGISVNYRVSNARVYNNVFFANTYYPIDIGNGSTGAIVKNNIIHQNGLATSNLGAGTILANNLTADPKFVNAGAADFSLQATSPAINTGATLTEVTNDFAGVLRPQGAAYDIGPYEYKALVSPPPAVSIPAAPSNLLVQ